MAPALGDPETREYRNLYEIQNESEGSRRRKRAGHERGRQGCHRDSADGQCRGNSDIGNGRHGKPEAWTNAPQVPTLTNGVERRLATEHQDDKGEGPQCIDPKAHLKFAHGQDAAAEGQQADTHDDARHRQVADAPRIRRRRRSHLVGRQ